MTTKNLATISVAWRRLVAPFSPWINAWKLDPSANAVLIARSRALIHSRQSAQGRVG
jgi:hypothetical protein